MNYRMIKYILGVALAIFSIALVFPLAMSCFEENWRVNIAFALTLLISAAASWFMLKDKPKRKSIYAKEGFVIVGLTWIMISLIGSLPYFVSRTIPGLVDALFESVSGFTTTGASILTDIESLPHSVLLWRAITHWIGGMGVLIFITAIVSFAGGNSMYLMRAEAAAPSSGKVAPTVRKNAIIIYSIYIGLTVFAYILLRVGDMEPFDSITNAFSLVATGGFCVRNASIAYYNSAYIEWVMIAFMIICSVNFHLIYLLLCRKFSTVFKNEELRWFFAIIAVSLVFVVIQLQLNFGGDLSENIRSGAFQLVAFCTTSGFISADYSLWPSTLMMLFLPLALLGGCSGSTAGGVKITRLLYLLKSARRELRKMLHPNAVEVVKVSGKPVEEEALSAVNVFFVAYVFCVIISLLLIAPEGFGLESTVSAVCASIGNIGIGSGVIGPGGSFAPFSDFGKLVFIFDMLLGRVGIFPIAFLFAPSIWSKRKNVQKFEM